MRASCLWAVCLLLVVSAVAWGGSLRVSQFGLPGITPRSLAMGGLAIGTRAGSTTWMQNPAGLGFPLYDGVANDGDSDDDDGFAEWMYEKSLDWISDDGLDADYYGGAFSAFQPQQSWGYGAGWGALDGLSHGGGAGVGHRFLGTNWAFGLCALGCFPDYDDDDLYVNVGAMYQPDPKTRAGFLVGDLTDRTGDGPYFSTGITKTFGQRATVGVDILDLTNRGYWGRLYNVGAEYKLGLQYEWQLRAGAVDMGDRHEFTAGIGRTYKSWRFDVGYQNGRNGDTVSAGATHFFH